MEWNVVGGLDWEILKCGDDGVKNPPKPNSGYEI